MLKIINLVTRKEVYSGSIGAVWQVFESHYNDNKHKVVSLNW